MRDYLMQLGPQIEEALRLGAGFSVPRSYYRSQSVLFCGMGGSAIGGDILKTLVLRNTPYPFTVCRNNTVPKWTNAKTLVIISSYSGNTGETNGALKSALKTGAKVIILTSGGRLKEIAGKKKLPCLVIPGGLPPRCAIGYLTFALIPVLRRLRLVRLKNAELKEAAAILKKIALKETRKAARNLRGRMIGLYGAADAVEPVLRRWRGQLAENAKTLSSYHVLPEMLHNEVEGWRFPTAVVRNFCAVFISDGRETPELKRKTKAAQRLLRRRGGKVVEVKARGKGFLARLFYLIYFGDWTSYELALLNRVDPVRIAGIEELKKID